MLHDDKLTEFEKLNIQKFKDRVSMEWDLVPYKNVLAFYDNFCIAINSDIDSLLDSTVNICIILKNQANSNLKNQDFPYIVSDFFDGLKFQVSF